jgi:DNA-binding response OmpR family regulator
MERTDPPASRSRANCQKPARTFQQPARTFVCARQRVVPSVQFTFVEQHGRILVIEDDERIGASLTRALDATGYTTTWTATAHDGEHAFRTAHATGPADSGRFDLVLLDLGLPDADGLDVCRRLVQIDPLVPIIMLTARDEELDLVIGLDAGATDYITKPFSLTAVLARLRAQLRRNTTVVSHYSTDDNQTANPRHLVIDSRTRKAFCGANEIILRAKEFDLLARLAAEPGTVVLRNRLMADVWDEHWFGSTKTLDFHIAALRKKLDSPGESTRITTVRGVGFRFEG